LQSKLSGIFDYFKTVIVEIQGKAQPKKRVAELKIQEHQVLEIEESREKEIQNRLKAIDEGPKPMPVNKEDKKESSWGGNGSGWKNKKKNETPQEVRKYTLGEALLGKKIKGETTPMDQLGLNPGEEMNSALITIKGRIYNIDSRDINENCRLFTFCITDETNAISCKIFTRKRNMDLIKENLKEDVWLKIEGNVAYDEYANEKVLTPKNMEIAERIKREDSAKEKRIELHMHSQYSNMDAVSKTAAIMQQAEDFGHDVVGITDHGVVQAYPEMLTLSRKKNIRVLYGVEGYLVNDDLKIIFGEQDEPFEGEFIFFDLETTGLVPGLNRIIEIGAVRINNGHIAETFKTFVDPEEEVPAHITELTGITTSMAQSEAKEEEAIKSFLDFCGDRILIAHNAAFDMSFLDKALEKYNLDNHFTYIDTLAMSRTFLQDISKHTLKKLASYFKIDMGHHHRAVDDALCSAKIFVKLLEMAEKKGEKRVQGLNHLMEHEQIMKSERPYHVIIYAKNQQGIKDLYKIVSEAHIKYFYKKPRIPKSLLAAHRENLIIGSACEAGELFKAVLNNLREDKLEKLAAFYDYFEVQPIGNNDYMVRNGTVKDEGVLQALNKRIIALGKKMNKPVVATGDVHFVKPEDAYFREILQAGQGYRDYQNQPPLYYHSTQEMLDEFDYLDPEVAYEIVVTNTHKIADMIEEVLPIPDGTYPPVIEGSDEEIKTMVYDKAHEMYGETLPKIVEDRIEKELNSIISNGYSVLYLIAQKLVQHSLEDGYLVGSRGSVGSSLVAMLSGITEVNSLQPHYRCPQCYHVEFFESTEVGVGADLPDANCPECGTKMIKDGFDIPFETFLGFKGDKEPDIDLNFSGENQSEAHHYTEVLFGQGKVYRAGTISTLAAKTAFGYVKGFYDDHEIQATHAERDRVIAGCAGVKKTTGQHPGGVMVVPKDKDIYDFTPIQYPADDRESGTLTTHFDYHSISGRLLKLDILGHDDPTMLRMLEDLTGKDPQSIPLDDKNVISLFEGVEALHLKDHDFDIPLGTCGVPEFGTNFVRGMVLDAKPKTMDDLIRISGLSHGTDVWLNNAQDLILQGTATIEEVICTRDDIMTGLIAMGLEASRSFTIMEHVRKGKGLTEEEETYMRDNKVPEWYIDSCKKIKYMFPKAHAAAYVMMAFRIAWYKVYEPLAYYATYFSIRAKEFNLDKLTRGKDIAKKALEEIRALGKKASNKEQGLLTSLELVMEMYCRGYGFKPVNLYKSHYKNFLIVDQCLLPPLNAVDGLGDKVAIQIYNEAQKKPFLSKEDLRKRSKVNKSNIESLEHFGCLNNLPDTNQMRFF